MKKPEISLELDAKSKIESGSGLKDLESKVQEFDRAENDRKTFDVNLMKSSENLRSGPGVGVLDHKVATQSESRHLGTTDPVSPHHGSIESIDAKLKDIAVNVKSNRKLQKSISSKKHKKFQEPISNDPASKYGSLNSRSSKLIQKSIIPPELPYMSISKPKLTTFMRNRSSRSREYHRSS